MFGEDRGRKMLNSKERASIVAFAEADKSVRWIYSKLGVSDSTVVDWKKKANEDDMVSAVLTKPITTAQEIADVTQISVGPSTIIRVLKKQNIQPCRVAQNFFLSPAQAEQRLILAANYVTRQLEWWEDILGDILPHSIHARYRGRRIKLIQDWSPIHQSRIIKQWFNDHQDEIELLPWPPKGANINPIENVCSDMTCLFGVIITMTGDRNSVQDPAYTYAIDNAVNFYRQLEHQLNCFGKQHYQAEALNFQLSSDSPSICCTMPVVKSRRRLLEEPVRNPVGEVWGGPCNPLLVGSGSLKLDWNIQSSDCAVQDMGISKMDIAGVSSVYDCGPVVCRGLVTTRRAVLVADRPQRRCPSQMKARSDILRMSDGTVEGGQKQKNYIHRTSKSDVGLSGG
ncbi:hypothetical protein OUZ56_026085 [Daphnia magna]|uniref:Tc1-like transposase DDE domain-containing protein n=1 Tax=Daphnia magna TaxID=35525 RepID=A0ABQ9ZKS9_9CRUS|nr:hypothetical protein OUZ56_026085 [Daphnia magna]